MDVACYIRRRCISPLLALHPSRIRSNSRILSVIVCDLNFWGHQAQQFGDPILERARGTGRVIVPLERSGLPRAYRTLLS